MGAVVNVRDLSAEDLDDLQWSGSPTHLRQVEVELERAERGEVMYLVAVVRDRPIAKVAVDLARHPEVAVLWQFAVHPDWQGLGVGTGLVAVAEDVARSAGKSEAEMAVSVDNAGAQRLYERLGYEAIGESTETWYDEWPDGRRERVTDRVRVLRKPLNRD